MSIFFFTEWRNQINQHTSYIDGSMVYGATDKDAKNLRTGYKGIITLLFSLNVDSARPQQQNVATLR